MTKFIWVVDDLKTTHYVNINHIVRIVNVPGTPTISSSPYAYIVLNDGTDNYNTIRLSNTTDTFEHIIAKIQVAMA